MFKQDVLRKLSEDAAKRKHYPIATGVIDYFPLALAAVAELSQVANEQHNPGMPLHWARGKSTDHDNCLIRHFIERGTRDTDGIRHSAKVAWRALAILQEEIERENGFVPEEKKKHEKITTADIVHVPTPILLCAEYDYVADDGRLGDSKESED